MTNTTSTEHLDLTRTRAALAALDLFGLAMDQAVTIAECRVAVASYDAARLAVGEAFALDTADRNDPKTAREFVAHGGAGLEFVRRLCDVPCLAAGRL